MSKNDGKMKVYVFGNPDVEKDALAVKVAKEVEGVLRLPDPSHRIRRAQDDKLVLESLTSLSSLIDDGETMVFEFVKPNEDLPFADQEMVVILDVVEGIDKVTVLTEKDLDKLVMPPRGGVHEYDLGFQLGYLMKLGKLKKVRIIGLPTTGV